MMLYLLSCSFDRAAEPAAQDITTSSLDREEARRPSRGDDEDWAPGGGEGGRAAPAPAAPPAARAAKSSIGNLAEADGLVAPAEPMQAEAEPAPTRAWFPESFLWTPLVEVPESGTVTIPVTVPDTLTTWRILALGQTRAGAQGGAVTTFASTLPAYVDLVVPTFLYTGDTLSLPVQAVNQQDGPLAESLFVEADGVAIGGGRVAIGAWGSTTERVTLTARRAGPMHVVARLGSLDTVDRVVPVRPVGRPVEKARGGTLGATRTFSLAGSPDGQDGSLLVTAFPGVLGVARDELEAAPSRGGGVAEAGYTWALTNLAAPLVQEGSLDPDTLRATQLRAWQRLAKAGRAPSPQTAVTALAALRVAPSDTLAGRLAIALAQNVRASQAPDGLWTQAAGTPLDVSLAETCRAVWALGADNQANRLRATGALERQRARLASPWLAAWALAADVADPGEVESLRKVVREAVATHADGSKTLRVDAVRADGGRVGEAESTAVAILALPKDDPVRADLASGLLGLYRPSLGFGDGWTGLLALEALKAVFDGEIPREVTVVVEIDGREAGRAVLDTKQPHAPVRVLAPALANGEHEITVRSEPAVPGLAFTAVARDYVPWVQTAPAGLQLAVSHGPLAVGQRSDVNVSVSGPAAAMLEVSVGLPAGVDPDRVALDALASSGSISAWHAEDGRVTLTGLRSTGGAWGANIPVTPTLAGRLTADASTVWPSGEPEQGFTVVPGVWEVR